jgi:hypothetical protein
MGPSDETGGFLAQLNGVANTTLNSVALRKGQRKSFDRGLTRVAVVLLVGGPAKP